jgi:hypothetical protein
MHVISLSALPVGGFNWQPRFGGHAFVIIAKVTFDLRPGKAQLAEVQDDLNEVDSHYSHDTQGSVYAPSDMAPFKERADVTLVGDVHAPTPRGSRSLVARLAVGEVDKKIAVHCDRWLDEKGRTCRGEPFATMPLRYELAAGGPDTDNPAGVDSTRQAAGDKQRRLPNLQRLGRHAGGSTSLLDSACFGPVAPSWPVRQRLLGGAANYWSEQSWRHRPLPPGVDTTFFNQAPSNQRLDELRVDDPIILEHLHPRWARLSCRLPGVSPRAFVEQAGAAREVALQADSLWIDMTRSLATLTWRGSFPMASADDEGRALVALQRAGELLTWPEVVEIDRRRGQRPSSVRLVQGEITDEPRCPESRGSAPGNEVVAAELPIAVGGEDTVVIPQPVPSSPLPFVQPTKPSVPEPHACASPTAQLKAVTTTPSPWALGSLTAARHALHPPPSPDHQRVTAPPLMVVPSASAPSAQNDAAQAPGSDDPAARLQGPLGKGHRIELLGYDDDHVDRMHQRWIDLVDEPAEEAVARELQSAFDSVPPLAPEQACRRLVRIMTRGETTGATAMGRTLSEAGDGDGLFEPPLVLVHGALRFPFEERATLEATNACVAPYLKGNDSLRETVDEAPELLAEPALRTSPDAAGEMTQRIRGACADDEAVNGPVVAARVERMLLDRRSYQQRSLLGGTWIRALVTTSDTTLPCYLPEVLALATPLFSTFPARIIAELHPRQDQFEDHPKALRAMALGRIITLEEAG